MCAKSKFSRKSRFRNEYLIYIRTPMRRPAVHLHRDGCEALSATSLPGHERSQFYCTLPLAAQAIAPTMPPAMPRPRDLSTELLTCSRHLPHVPTSPSHDKGRSPELTGPDRELGRSHLHCDNARQLLHHCSYDWSPNGFQLLPFPDACRLPSNCLHHGLYTAPTIQERFDLLRNYNTTLKTASQLP